MFVVDASVYASIAVRDEFYKPSTAFLARSRDLGSVTLDLALIEAYNVLWKHAYLLRRIPVSKCVSIAENLERVFKNSVVRVYSAASECKDAVKLAVAYGITIYDSTYLVLARKLNYRLATLDRKLEEKLRDTELRDLIYILA